MSARSQRRIHETSTTKRYLSPRVKNRCVKQQITYDYDAAVSQPDVPHFLELRKNGRCPMKRSQARGLKSRCKRNANSRPSDGNDACCAHGGPASSGVSDEERDVGEKENVTSNGTVDVDTASNFFKRNVTGDGQNASCKDATLEAVETSDKNPVAEKKVKIESPNDGENAAAKSPVLQVKGSRIPRVKIAAFPVHTPQENPPAKKVTISIAKDPTERRSSSTTCTPDNADTEQLQTAKGSCDDVQEQITYKQEMVRSKAIRKDSKTVWNAERASETDGDEEAEGDLGLASADESTAIIGNVDDPRVLTILRSLKLNCPCKSCTDHEPASKNQREDDSDLKSSSPEEERRKKWFKSLKHHKFAGTSSEEVCVYSDANSEKSRRKKRSRFRVKSTLSQRVKTSSIVNATPKIYGHRRTSFSFFNTLFDIVFWPYVFLKANR